MSHSESYRYPAPPNHLMREAKWRKEKALNWFHHVTSTMSDGEILVECMRRGLSVQGKTIHDMQTALLDCEAQD